MTTESENIDRVTNALKTVPEKKLLIIELVNSIPIKDGQLDYEELTRRQPEINLAVTEAKMYGAHTIQAVQALRGIEAGAK